MSIIPLLIKYYGKENLASLRDNGISEEGKKLFALRYDLKTIFSGNDESKIRQSIENNKEAIDMISSIMMNDKVAEFAMNNHIAEGTVREVIEMYREYSRSDL